MSRPPLALDPAKARDIRLKIRDFAAGRGRGRAVDLAQHERGRGTVRPRAVSFARQNPAPGRSAPICRKSMAGPSLEDLFVTVAQELLSAGAGVIMQTVRIAAIVLRQFYLICGGASARSHVRGGDRTSCCGLHEPCQQHRLAGLQFRAASLVGAILVGFFHARDAGCGDVVPRGCVVAQFPQPVRDADYCCLMLCLCVCAASSSMVLVSLAADAGARAAFGLSFFAYGLALVPFLLTPFLFGIALGILACASSCCASAGFRVWFMAGSCRPLLVFFIRSRPCRIRCRRSGICCRRAHFSKACARSCAGNRGDPATLAWGVGLGRTLYSRAGGFRSLHT